MRGEMDDSGSAPGRESTGCRPPHQSVHQGAYTAIAWDAVDDIYLAAVKVQPSNRGSCPPP